MQYLKQSDIEIRFMFAKGNLLSTRWRDPTPPDMLPIGCMTFDGNFVSFKTAYVWRPHSPDLSPLDFFLREHLKGFVYKP